jgi:indolepyruvate decarboxylase
MSRITHAKATPRDVVDAARAGDASAAPSRRTVLLTGDGSHQLTANDIGPMGRYGAKPVIILLNNSMFGVEEVLAEVQGHVYNFVAPWNYHELPAARGCTGWYTARVTTVGGTGRGTGQGGGARQR